MFRRRSDSAGGATPRARESLGRKLALVILPIVLIPLVALGVLAYFRSRAILQGQIQGEMVSATETQIQSLEEWAREREQQLVLAYQSSVLTEQVDTLLRQRPGSASYAGALEEARAALASFRSRSGQTVFSDMLVARIGDGVVLAATETSWQGQGLTLLASGTISTTAIGTLPVYGDAILGPDSVVVVTSAPLRTPGSETPPAMLIGVNRGLRIGQLMTSLQVFWQQRGVFIVETGNTYLAFAPDIILRLTRYATEPELLNRSGHPVFAAQASDLATSREYSSLDDVPVLGTFQWLPEWQMAVVNEVPQELIYAGLSTLAPYTAALIGAAAFFTVLVVIVATNRLLRPLGPLTEFAGRISRGDWEYRVPADRQDELGVLGRAFNRMADDLSGMYRSLEARVEERTRQVRTASEVARAVISTPNLEDLMRRAVDLIRERFGYYHAAIFLLDETGETAVLRAATGEVGAALIARGHKLSVGSNSIIGWVTSNKEPRVASDVSRDPIHFKSELLPGTRSEAAVPLQVAGRVVGALDVQSLEPNAFTPEDLALLQTLADQLSAAIQNARLAQTSALAADRARLITEATTKMTGVLDMNRVLMTAAEVLHRALGQPEIIVQLAEGADGGSRPGAPESENGEGEA